MAQRFFRSAVGTVRSVSTDRPGRAFACLSFRAGMGDVPPAKQGLCHLLEHLAMFPFRSSDLDCNASVDHLTTTFYAEGEQNEVRDFIEQLTRSLAALPYERLAKEKNVLRVESSGSFGVLSALARCRYGVSGLGAHTLDEIGLESVDENDLETFRRDYFVRQNAVLATSFDPAGLDLEALPSGRAHLDCPFTQRAMEYPAVIDGADDEVALSFELQRSPAASALTRMLGKRVSARSRGDLALSYHTNSQYIPLSAERADAFVISDVDNKNAEALVFALLDLVDDVSVNGFTDEELESSKRQVRPTDDFSFVCSELLNRAELLLLECEVGELEDVTLEEVNALAKAIPASLVVSVPEITKTLEARLRPSRLTVDRDHLVGQNYRPARGFNGDDAMSLVVGEGSFGLVFEDGSDSMIEMRYEDVVVCATSSDGLVRLVDSDSRDMYVHPLWFRDGHEALRRIEQELSDDVKLERLVSEFGDLTPNAQDMNRLGFRLLLATVVASLLCISVLVGWVVYSDRQNAALVDVGGRATATVLADMSADEAPGVHKPLSVEFLTETGDRVATDVNVQFDVAFPVGSTLEVAYDRNRPQRAEALDNSYDPAIDQVSGWLIAAVTVLFIGAWFLIRTAIHRQVLRSDRTKTMLAEEVLEARWGMPRGRVFLFDPADPDEAVLTVVHRLAWSDLLFKAKTEVEVVGELKSGRRIVIDSPLGSVVGKAKPVASAGVPLGQLSNNVAMTRPLIWSAVFMRMLFPFAPIVGYLGHDIFGWGIWGTFASLFVWTLLSSAPFELLWRRKFKRANPGAVRAQLRVAMQNAAVEYCYGPAFSGVLENGGMSDNVVVRLLERRWIVFLASAAAVTVLALT